LLFDLLNISSPICGLPKLRSYSCIALQMTPHNPSILLGASMVKWTKLVPQYTKTIISLVKGRKTVAKCCLNWVFLKLFLMMASIVVLNAQMLDIKLRSSIVIIKE
jgi:hypothetical protein